ncbi:hypothetical protein D3C87_1822100 [compost metagenome]
METSFSTLSSPAQGRTGGKTRNFTEGRKLFDLFDKKLTIPFGGFRRGAGGIYGDKLESGEEFLDSLIHR